MTIRRSVVSPGGYSSAKATRWRARQATRAALAALRDVGPGGVLVGVNLPDASGFGVAPQLAQGRSVTRFCSFPRGRGDFKQLARA